MAIAEVEEGGEYSIPRVPAAKPVTARACFLRRKTSSMRVVDGTYPRKKERKETLVLGQLVVIIVVTLYTAHCVQQCGGTTLTLSNKPL